MAKKSETAPVGATNETEAAAQKIADSTPLTVADLKPGEIGQVSIKAVRRGDRENIYVERSASTSHSEGVQVRRNGLGELEVNRWTINLNAPERYEGPKEEWEYAHLI